ncbi:MAG: tyrosine-type recombinase/integrase [Gemmataceae bacterium]
MTVASIERRGGSSRIVFRYRGEKRSFSLGDVSAADAAAAKAVAEELLRLLDRNLVAVPAGCTVEDFLFHRGNPPAAAAAVAAGRGELTLAGLWDAYLSAHDGKLEATTLAGMRLHFGHLTRVLGGPAVVPDLGRADLQRYVDARADEWIDPDVYRRRREERAAAPKRKSARKGSAAAPPALPAATPRPRRHPSAATVRKEVVSLRTTWNWARRHLGLGAEFPGGGLVYAKTEEALPFMTWDEAERRVEAGADPEAVWEAVYLRPVEVSELLDWVRGRPVSPWVYPLFCFAAHTGARRSEIVRAAPADLDLASGVVTIREKKRDQRRLTTRRVPLSPFLGGVLKDWMGERAAGRTLFCKGDGRPIGPREAHNYFRRALRVSKWSVLRGWHVFRHSFVSALASRGVDQRVIDDLVGHATDEQRRRYRHLHPDVTRQAVAAVFG